MTDERGHRDDLISPRQLGLLQQIYDDNPVASGQVLFADRLEIPQRRSRTGALAGNVESQDPFFGARRLLLLTLPRAFMPAPRASCAHPAHDLRTPSSRLDHNAVVAQLERPPLRRVRHAARFQNRQVTTSLFARG